MRAEARTLVQALPSSRRDGVLRQSGLTLADLEVTEVTRILRERSLQKVTAGMTAADVPQPEFDAYVEAHREQLSQSRSTRIEWVEFADEKEARKVADEIARGDHRAFDAHPAREDFDGVLVNEELRSAVATLRTGEYSREPLATRNFGHLVVHLIAPPPSPEDFLAMKSPEIREKLLVEKQEQRFQEWIDGQKRTVKITKGLEGPAAPPSPH